MESLLPLDRIVPFVGSISVSTLKTFGISHFGRIKIINRVLMNKLLDDRAWDQIYVQEESFNDIDLYGLSEILDADGRAKIFHDPCALNFLLLHEKSEQENEVFFFGADEENKNLLNYYIRYPRVLNYFLFYLKEKMYPFLKIKKPEAVKINVLPLSRIDNHNFRLIDLRGI